MFTRRSGLIALSSLALNVPLMAQEAKARLLPESFARKIGVNWQQDGRAVELSFLVPKGDWVVTEVLLEFQFPVEAESASSSTQHAKQRSPARKGPEPQLDLEALDRSIREMEARDRIPVSTLALPGRTFSTHVELKRSAKAIAVVLVEARGRAPTTFERLKVVL